MIPAQLSLRRAANMPKKQQRQRNKGGKAKKTSSGRARKGAAVLAAKQKSTVLTAEVHDTKNNKKLGIIDRNEYLKKFHPKCSSPLRTLEEELKNIRISAANEDDFLEKSIQIAVAEKKMLLDAEKRNRTKLPCSHGFQPLPERESWSDMAALFFEKFVKGHESTGDGFMVARNATAIRYASVWGDPVKIEYCIEYLLSWGAQLILDGEVEEMRMAYLTAIITSYFEQWVAVELHQTQEEIDWEKIKRYGDHRVEDHKPLIRYFKNRIPCSCLDDKYKGVDLQIVQLGKKSTERNNACKHGLSRLNNRCLIFIQAFEKEYNTSMGGKCPCEVCSEIAISRAWSRLRDMYEDVAAPAKLECVVSHYAWKGTQAILSGDIVDARACANFAFYFHNVNTRSTPDPSRRFELMSADEHTLVRFFKKRIPCSCLDELYKKVKDITRIGICSNERCGNRIERSSMLNCSRCRKANYCSPGCQKEHWEKHKVFCKWAERIEAKLQTK